MMLAVTIIFCLAPWWLAGVAGEPALLAAARVVALMAIGWALDVHFTALASQRRESSGVSIILMVIFGLCLAVGFVSGAAGPLALAVGAVPPP